MTPGAKERGVTVLQVQVSDDAAGRIADALQALDLHAKELIGYSALRTKVRTREDASEYVEAERLIGIYDALRGDS